MAGQTTPVTARPPAEPAAAPESISGSYVYLNRALRPDDCYTPGRSQTFCLQAISYTDDWDYVNSLWVRFPEDWTIDLADYYDVPYGVNGGTLGDLNTEIQATPNEARINHLRYHANPSDTCTAYYCFEVTPGHASPGEAPVSWYWVSGGYGSPPYRPCSSDGYTPAGHTPCDETTSPAACIEPCPVHVVYLPAVLKNRQ